MNHGGHGDPGVEKRQHSDGEVAEKYCEPVKDEKAVLGVGISASRSNPAAESSWVPSVDITAEADLSDMRDGRTGVWMVWRLC